MCKEIIVSELDSVSIEERIFELEQRKAKAMISGSILPQHFRNIGDVIILDEMSRVLSVPTVMLAQGVYIVKGKPSMSGQLVIAILNGSGRFDAPINWEEREKPWGVRAYASIDGEVYSGEWIDDDLIKRNGWGNNPHWVNNKSLMAKYRAASWFARLFAPDLLLGFRSEGEVEDIIETTVTPVSTNLNKTLLKAAAKPKPKKKEKVVEAEVEPVTPENHLVTALMERGIARSKALVYAKENSADAETLFDDPGALDAIAEGMR